MEVDGRRVEVIVRGQLAGVSAPSPLQPRPRARPRRTDAAAGPAVGDDTVVAPMQGTVVKIAVEDGQQVAAGELVAVLEAMKMENPVTAHKDGIVTGLAVQPGAFITQGAPIAQLK